MVETPGAMYMEELWFSWRSTRVSGDWQKSLGTSPKSSRLTAPPRWVSGSGWSCCTRLPKSCLLNISSTVTQNSQTTVLVRNSYDSYIVGICTSTNTPGGWTYVNNVTSKDRPT